MTSSGQAGGTTPVSASGAGHAWRPAAGHASGAGAWPAAAALHTARSGLARLPEVLEGTLEDAVERGGSVVDRLTGRRSRRWPWAAGAAVAGAAAGAGSVLLLRRLVGQDAPDAQEPEQLRAVVDPAPGR